MGGGLEVAELEDGRRMAAVDAGRTIYDVVGLEHSADETLLVPLKQYEKEDSTLLSVYVDCQDSRPPGCMKCTIITTLDTNSPDNYLPTCLFLT
jgi:hypothetical protein